MFHLKYFPEEGTRTINLQTTGNRQYECWVSFRNKFSRFNFFSVPASVVFLFFVSWTPFHFQRLGYVYFKSAELFREVNQYLFYFSGEAINDIL